MAKSGLQTVAQFLAEKHKISLREAEAFVSTLIEVMNEGLRDDRLLKVKGLGTFKVIDTKERESIDVRTGERILIGGRSKISFTPDSVMKDLVNKPFSQFETVVLNDGVRFDDLETDNADSATDVIVNEDEDEFEEETPLVQTLSQEAEVLNQEEEVPLIQEDHTTLIQEEDVQNGNGEAEAQEYDVQEYIEPSDSESQRANEPNDQTTNPLNDQTTNPPNDQTANPLNDQTTNPPNDQTTNPPNDQTVNPPNDQTTNPLNDQTEVIVEEQPVEEAVAAPPLELLTPAASHQQDVPSSDGVDSSPKPDGEAEHSSRNGTIGDGHGSAGNPALFVDEQENRPRRGGLCSHLLTALIAALVGLCAGWLIRDTWGPLRIVAVEEPNAVTADTAEIDTVAASPTLPDSSVADSIEQLRRDSIRQAVADSIAQARRDSLEQARRDSIERAKKEQQAQQQEPKPAQPTANDNAALTSARRQVELGAYRIVGTQETITVRPGQTMARLAKFYFGDGMECYLQVYNGIAEVQPGQRLRIPKLQWKKKR